VAAIKSSPPFQIGQCWTSEGEPELGIGFVKALDATSVAIEYPSAGSGRLYRRKAPPLRRLIFQVGEKVQSKAGQSMTVERIDIRDELNWYIGAEGSELCESEVSPKFTLQRPMERFLAGHWDSLKAFSLRRRTLDYYYQNLRAPSRGMIGPRVQLLPHQVYVTHEICRRGLPRALLADEVGLGKTIEAAFIMHRLLATERIRRVLIIVPESLVNQWFVELFRRFNLSFWVPASQSEEDLEADDISDQERVILSLESIPALFEKGILKPDHWDLVIVDEAHRVKWNQEEPSPEYKILQSLAEKTPGLLLLTATPQQLGLDGHFSRLHLIDAERFPALSDFKEEHLAYLKVVKLAGHLLAPEPIPAADFKTLSKLLEGIVPPEQIETNRRLAVNALNDHYGTGRVYFRNSRAVVELEQCAFPKRNLRKHLLAGEKVGGANQSMLSFLAEFAQTYAKEKTLLICASAKQVIEWEKKLRDDFALKVVSFHEEQTLLARDRNAAYFEDPAGASLLLCSEIGGEGRNFQHASHLILADLPLDPDVLEQRIGRLDRIGQASDISIHVPYLEKSQTERLLRFHEDVFHGFTSPPKGAHEIFTQYREELLALQEKTITVASEKVFADLLTRAKADYETQLAKIEAGRDRLIEINSFDSVLGSKLVHELEASEKVEVLKSFFEELLDAMGLHSDDLDKDSLFVDPGHGQYVSYFPGLPPEGLSFTFSRTKALARTDLTLMTWDHPMVNETLAQLAGQEFGNVCVAAWAKPLLVLDCTFVFAAATTEAKWYADEFFPSTPIRIVFESTGRELTDQLEWKNVMAMLTPLSPTATAFVKKLPGERIRGLLNKAMSEAQGKSQALKQNAILKMNETLDGELNRLKVFQTKNKLVSEKELEWWNERKKHLLHAFAGSQLRLDSFLLIVPETLGS
jgi:ATP-dependent helicase HepA